MRQRLKYLFFIVCIILLALMAPVFLFSLKDRIDNQTLYAENQDITVSDILTNNYIEDDGERYTTWLYHQSQGVEYAVMELDSTLSDEELSALLLKTFLYQEADYSFIRMGITSVSHTQYAVYNTEDHTDIIFLLTLITIQMYRGSSSYDTLRILVDSQTGMLYFMGIYYAWNLYEDADNYNQYSGIFSDDAGWAVASYQELLYTNISDLYLSCSELIGLCLSPFLDHMTGDVSCVEARSDSTFTAVEGFADLTGDSGYLTGVEFTVYKEATTFPISTAVYTSDGDSYVTVTFTTQFNKWVSYFQEDSDFGPYQCNLCIGLEDMAFLLPEFYYWKPSVG
ncbi:MAG: hypothetical protein LUI10_10320 [Lachnospiraceae bacterium]|nr:hypothetical protein [Lachnospiraceae bacterium]